MIGEFLIALLEGGEAFNTFMRKAARDNIGGSIALQGGDPAILDQYDPDDLVTIYAAISNSFAARHILMGNIDKLLSFVEEMRVLEDSMERR